MRILIFILCTLGPFGPRVRASGEPEKLALLIALSQYQDSGWNTLPPDAAQNNIGLIRTTLLQKGFNSQHIATLTNRNATAKAIDVAMNKLIRQAQSNGKDKIIVVYFFGHGQQLADDNGDEIADGLDEVLIAYDTPRLSGHPAKVQTLRHIRDDNIEGWMTQLQKNTGNNGHVWLITDSCHSGSISRNTETEFQLGGTPALGISAATGTDTGSGFGELTRSSITSPRLVVMTACSSQEEAKLRISREKAYGAFTYALAESLASVSGPTSYQQLYGQVVPRAARWSAIPQVEGLTDIQVLGLNKLQTSTYLTIHSYKEQEPDYLYIKGGRLLGLYRGTEVAVFPSGQSFSTKVVPITTGVVTQESDFVSKVRINKRTDFHKPELKNAWIYITKPGLAEKPLKIKVAYSLNSSVTGKNLLNRLRTLKLVEVVSLKETSDLILTTKENQLVALDHNYATLTQSKNADDFIEFIKRYARTHWIKGWEVASPDFQVDARLSDGKGIPQDQGTSLPVFGKNRPARLSVTNRGGKPVFLTVLFIGASGKPFLFTEGTQVGVRKSYALDISFEEPFGTEYLKIIATSERIQLSPLLASTRIVPQTEIEEAFQALYDDEPETFSSRSATSIDGVIKSIVYQTK